ncbi:hypothetical protein LP418_05935 [Nocardioides sp. B-3]|nr:hypothetical protein LP418_05935 [Nocardioides sp. B-3]
MADTELEDAVEAIIEIIEVLEGDQTYVNLSPYREPQLGRHGLYPTTGGKSASDEVMAMLWTLGYSDGETSLLQVAQRSGLRFADVRRAAVSLADAGLLKARQDV